MLDKLTKETFDAHKESTFQLKGEGEQSFDLKLVEVNELSEKGSTPERRAFSVLFRGPKDLQAEQSIHRLEHGEMGKLELFLVPLGPDPDAEGTLFEAVFS